MKDKYFLDTNIFVYTFDSQAKQKSAKAQELIENALTRGDGVISHQVIQEFLNVATRKFSTPLNTNDAKLYLDKILIPLCTVYPSYELFNSALLIADHAGFSFYDSMIIAAAHSAGCKKIYTEDLQHHQIVNGMEIINPFKHS